MGSTAHPGTRRAGRLRNAAVSSVPEAVAGFVWDGEILTSEDPMSTPTWADIDASGGWAIPAFISAVDPEQLRAAPEAYAARGVATVLLPLTPPAAVPPLPFDIVPIAAPPAPEAPARRVLTDASAAPAALAGSTQPTTVRVPAGDPALPAWIELTRRQADIRLVITEVTDEAFDGIRQLLAVPDCSGAEAGGSRAAGRITLETTSDLLAAHPDTLGRALLEGTIELVSMPHADSPSILALLHTLTSPAGAISICAQVCARNPARIYGIDDRKGALSAGRHADALVVDPHTPGLSAAERPRGHVRFALRRGAQLLLHNQIHVPGDSGRLALPAAEAEGETPHDRP